MVQQAGAQTILMSLWKIPDKETRELMIGFYENWSTGQTKKESLRKSILDILNSCRSQNQTTHPLLWGGFVMVGNPD
jgi:CHAT domain-containing protein